MQFSMTNLFQHPDEGKSNSQLLGEVVEQAIAAEELGFDRIWLAEHHFSRYGILGSPLVFAAAIAQATKRIRIGTAVLVLPFYHPLRLAEECALVDVLSGGRLDIGYGRGYQPKEFAGFGANPAESREVTEETIAIMKLAWTRERFSFKGKHFDINDVEVHPRPLQQPHPPLFMAASSPESFEKAGREGLRILTAPSFTPLNRVTELFEIYVAALAQAGHSSEEFERPILLQTYIGENEQDALATPEPYAMWYQRMLGKLVPGADGKLPAGYESWSKISENIARVTYDEVREHGAVFETSEAAIVKLRRIQDAAGITEFIAWFNFGGIRHEQVLGSMERFAKNVIPAVKATSKAQTG